MSNTIVVPIKWDPVFLENIHNQQLYHLSLTRFQQLLQPNDHLVIAASNDPQTRDFIHHHVQTHFPHIPITYGSENEVWERIYKSVSSIETHLIIRASLTQPLFNISLYHQMLLYFQQRFHLADYLYQIKYPTALAFDFIKKDTLAKIVSQSGSNPNLLNLRLPHDVFRPLEYIPPYNQSLASCPTDLRVTTLLDIELNSQIWRKSKGQFNLLSIQQTAQLIQKVLDNFKFPSPVLTTQQKKAIQKKFRLPHSISFEVISTCILDCEFCILKDLKSWKYRRKTIMSLDEFKKIIDDIAWFTTFIDFSGGEPLLNKEIFDMCHYARQKNIYTMISSNIQLLSRDNNLEKLLQSPPDEIIIAYDGLEKEVYETIRKKGNFELLVKNIEDLVRLKKERNAQFPLLTMQMVLTKKNRHMKQDFWKAAQDFGVDKAMIKPIGLWPEADPQYDKKMTLEYIVPRNEESISRHDIVEGEPVFIRWPGQCPCANLSYIGSGGEVLPCYYIVTKIPFMGNALDKGFFQVWNSKKYREYRDKMRNSWANPLCHRCIGLSTGTELEIRHFSKNNK